MPGQVVVTISDKQWQCTMASTPQELVTGLSGVESISPGTGMLFDMGWDYPVIDIYTDEMLFPLDIIFINSAYGVIEVLRNVRPGDEAIFQGEPGAWFFLEVNAGEAEGIEVGDGVLFQPGEEVPATPNWITWLVGLIGFAAMGVFMAIIGRELVKKALEEPLASKREALGKSPAVIPAEGKPTGTCYADAWRFVIREGEGELIHGTVYSENRRIGHAWVETSTGWIWEPETGRYFTRLGFRDAFAPIIESRYTAEEAAIYTAEEAAMMAARIKNLGPWSEQDRRRYLKEKSPTVIPEHPRQPRLKDELEFLPDSPEFLAYTINDIGYREKIDSAFLNAIARAKGG